MVAEASLMKDPILFNHEDEFIPDGGFDFIYYQPQSSTSSSSSHPNYSSSQLAASTFSSSSSHSQSHQIIPVEFRKVLANVADDNNFSSIDDVPQNKFPRSNSNAIAKRKQHDISKKITRSETNKVKSTSNATKTTSSSSSPMLTQSISDQKVESERFLQEFPLNRCTAMFATREEMEETLSTLTWSVIRSRFHWGYMNGGGDVDYVMVRDDIKKKNVAKSRLIKFGVEGVHYFNYINRYNKVELNERSVVEYFKRYSLYHETS